MNSILGSKGDSTNGDATPLSSSPGTPALGNIGLSLGLGLSGRASRQSDSMSNDRLSMGTGTFVQSQSGTDHLMERYVVGQPYPNVSYTSFRTLVPQYIPDLVDVEQELFELPQKARASS